MELELIDLKIIENLIEYGIKTLKDEYNTETHHHKKIILKDIIKDYKKLKQKFTNEIKNHTTQTD